MAGRNLDGENGMDGADVRRRLALLFAFVFIDVLGFSLILPLLPYYAAAFAATPSVVGLLLGANAAAQFIGAPVIGKLSDRYGRRPLLILSISGTVVSFVMLGLARSLAMLFASRIVDGLLGGNISLAQAYITDVTDDENRARGLGLIGAAFGLGFIFGPALGGTLSAGGNYSLPSLLAAGLSALNLIGVIIWLPESLPAEQRAQLASSPRAALTPRAMWDALSLPCVGPLLQVRVFFGLAFTTFQSVFALFAQKRLGLEAQITGYVLTYVGLLVVAVQGGGIGLLTKRFRDKELVFGGTVLMTLALVAWAWVPTLGLLLAVLAPLALAGGVLNVVTNSALTKSVYPEEVGGILGLSASIGSLTRVVSPIVGAFLLDRVGTSAPGLGGAVLMAWLIVYTWREVLFVPDLVCPQPRWIGALAQEAEAET
jgi:DHA1 family tetracycline resistance protein-like MFS transporter